MANGPGSPVPTISTHVLDTERGVPAAGIHVTLYWLSDDGRALRLTQALTDTDGRVRDLLERPLTLGDYRLEFALGPLAPADSSAPADEPERFFRRITVDIHVTDTGRSYHVPLLVAPYSVSTYRGS